MKYYVKKGFYQFTFERILESDLPIYVLEHESYLESQDMFRNEHGDMPTETDAECEAFDEQMMEEIECVVEEFDPSDSRHKLVEEYPDEGWW